MNREINKRFIQRCHLQNIGYLIFISFNLSVAYTWPDWQLHSIISEKSPLKTSLLVELNYFYWIWFSTKYLILWERQSVNYGHTKFSLNTSQMEFSACSAVNYWHELVPALKLCPDEILRILNLDVYKHDLTWGPNTLCCPGRFPSPSLTLR